MDEYRHMPRNYRLSSQQKLQYLHNLLLGDAKRFYLDVIDEYAASFQQSVELVEKQYNSHVRQNKVKNYLKYLRMSSFVNDGMDMSEPLEKVYKTITEVG